MSNDRKTNHLNSKQPFAMTVKKKVDALKKNVI